jgi:hypothetical protein
MKSPLGVWFGGNQRSSFRSMTALFLSWMARQRQAGLPAAAPLRSGGASERVAALR